ncbi:spore coat protein YutH [Bacillus sp. HMF5848]|uniref:spore coat putative kinase YutH n=1 Tax=Bacillus sp. HMF5848 TaxID=2495421 RepID=UPI000F76BAAB|nr:spore coat protein YutH [Bacillus sp. HMF5848]RSK28435.1 spore coat protein YutH [Bacillus sp. HMF5848]
MIEDISKHYDLTPHHIMRIGEYEGFRERSTLYIIIPIQQMDQKELQELILLSEYMGRKRQFHVATFVKNKKNKYLSKVQDRTIALLQVPYTEESRYSNVSTNLARFHKVGARYPYEVTSLNRLGYWKIFWEKRLDQLEQVWRQVIAKGPVGSFEVLFVDVFPYYMGLTENAIQYVVDTELDIAPTDVDVGTVCHQRFTRDILNITYNLPVDWVFDHCSRDLAEWIRHETIHNDQVNKDIQSFLIEYNQQNPLSPFGWRLLYARVLFPLTFFTNVENGLMAPEESRGAYEDNLRRLIENSDKHEYFLAYFYENMLVPRKQWKIPSIQWLTK